MTKLEEAQLKWYEIDLKRIELEIAWYTMKINKMKPGFINYIK